MRLLQEIDFKPHSVIKEDCLSLDTVRHDGVLTEADGEDVARYPLTIGQSCGMKGLSPYLLMVTEARHKRCPECD